ncbi:MAG: c-type cytochrome [Fuerstiella sp.]
MSNATRSFSLHGQTTNERPVEIEKTAGTDHTRSPSAISGCTIFYGSGVDFQVKHKTSTLCGLLFSTIWLVIGSSGRADEANSPHALIPGYERFRTERLSAAEAGRLLISELNCQSCHGPVLHEALPQRVAPILTSVASRVQYEHLKAFIVNPQGLKPGTAMPQVLHGPTAADEATALAHFLAAGGAPVPTPVSSAAIARGQQLFHTLGCAACHGDQRKPAGQRPEFVMPLGQLDTKYTVGSLSTFLKDPHAVRPSGRMPSLNLSDEEARDVANYLLQNIEVEPNLTVEVFEGNWDKLPDFDALQPISTGPATGFDVAATDKKNEFALRFRAFLHVPQAGEYQFWLGSDDGSRLLIDGTEVVNVDGIHPHSVKESKISLTAGAHPVVVEYFEKGGEESLNVEVAGPNLPRQDMSGLVSNSSEPPERRIAFQPDADLVAQGQRLFNSRRCASCHRHEGSRPTTDDTRSVPPFAALDLSRGCLAESPSAEVPRFALSSRQRADIVAALTNGPDNRKNAAAAAPERIHDAMLTLNCFACHQRDGVGGVPRAHDELFAGSIPEMGDEGRIPPHLDGIGDKLQESWLKQVMNRGAKDRPYMATRMPKFGEANVGRLIDLFVAQDRKQEVPVVEFEDPMHRVTAEARLMVGDQALSCIKCHYFDTHKATGIQSLDMTTMTTRLRRDWFHRYLLNPQAYRPGTRMPSAWPNNKSVVPKILHGDPAQQIEAIWQYLSAGKKAKLPSGLVAKVIELKPEGHPIIYRNFIEGLSPRGIAVGYPEKAHIAWDAEQMNLRLIWHGAFIDASKHWIGRGPGFQAPLGDHVLPLTEGQPLAVLDSPTKEWPAESARDAGYQFGGYRLNDRRQPAFHYRWNDIRAVDFIEPVAGDEYPSLRRTLHLTADQPAGDLYFRIGSADSITPQDGGWLLDNAILITSEIGKPVVRKSAGRQELLVPVNWAADNTALVQYEISW